MADERRLIELLDELQDSGLSPEDLCGDCPELLPALRDRWRRLRRLEAALDSMFPPETEGVDRGPGPHPGAANAPTIPGYEIEGLLGRGGMGVVFRARQVELNRVVAIKLAIAGTYASSHERERFRREARAVAALRHANVVQVHDIGDCEGRPYFTMEFVAGGSLAERDKPIPPRRAAAPLPPLTGALQATHAAGIIHRDLTPGNILLDEDGHPKSGDFGLSRRIDDAATLTGQGAVVGTPSYMAPEQAAGDHAAIGASVDIYSMGAILYELLTGRPPFRGGSPSETIKQILHADPPPPSRLNAKIPRDIEIICLKCLSKDPARRYPSAASLGEDLSRFMDGEAIMSRPEGRAAWLVRRARRNPNLTAMLVCIVLLVTALAGGGLWFAADRAEMARRAAVREAADVRSAEGDLRDMSYEMGWGEWSEARMALDRAQRRLGDRGSTGLDPALARGRRDLDLVARLEAIRMGRARTVGGMIDYAGADGAYARIFRNSGFGGPDEDPEAVAGRVRASDARKALVDALDDWPVPVGDARHKEWNLRVARLASGGEAGWVGDARDPRVRRSRVALERLADAASPEGESVALLLSVADDLREAGGDPVPFLTRVQRARPGDFWANLNLGSSMSRSRRHAEGIRYFQAALSIRPEVAIAYNNLGNCLADSGRQGDSIEYFRSALRIDPTASIASYNLGHVLRSTGRADQAIEALASGLKAAPDNALLHAGLGDTLAASTRHAEATSEYQLAISFDPRLDIAQSGLRTALIRLGRPAEAYAAWQRAIEANPDSMAARDGYAEFCLFLGHASDYAKERIILLDRFGGSDDHQLAERIGRACLLQPLPPREATRAAALIDRALSDGPSPPPPWTRPYFLLAKGLAEFRLAHFESSIEILKGDASRVLGPCPLLITAMAQARMGLAAKAEESLAAAVRSHDWSSPIDNREAWIYGILRREAETVVHSRKGTNDHPPVVDFPGP